MSTPDRTGCHQKHEGMEIVQLKDFEANMAYIKRVSPEHFWKRVLKLTEHYQYDEKVKAKLVKLALEV